MEYRKLIGFGNSSHVVSMPKAWLQKNGLKKGDNIFLEIKGKDIILSARETPEDSDVETVINIDNTKMDVVSRKINSAYINGSDTIRISGSNMVEKAKEIKEVIRNLMAMETISQTTDSIVARSFLNMHEVNIENLIRRTDHVIVSMFNAVDALTKKKGSEADEMSESIVQRDGDVNRITFLIFRALNTHLKTPRKYKGTVTDPVRLWGVTFFMEETADELKRISRLLVNVKDGKILKDILRIIKETSEIYMGSMKAFYKNDKDLVYEMSARRKPLIDKCNALLKKNFKNPFVIEIMDKNKDLIDRIHSLNRMSY